jgi:hypothetical protein
LSIFTGGDSLERTAKIGYYSGLLYAIYIILIDILYIIFFIQPNPWTSLAEYSARYQFIEVLPSILGFGLYPLLIFVCNSVIRQYGVVQSIPSILCSFCARCSTIIIISGYFIQFAVVHPMLLQSTGEGYELWMFGNPNSIAWGLNYLGWFLGAVAILCWIWMIKNRLIQVFSISYFILIAIAFVGYSLRNSLLQIVLGAAWFVFLPILFALVAKRFKTS